MNKKLKLLDKLAFGGQALANVELPDGNFKKAFVWGGMPGEEVEFMVTKKRAGIYEGIVTNIIKASKNRVEPIDKEAYLSTSPWQIMAWDYELKQKSLLTQQAFAQQHLIIEPPIVITDNQEYNYRNKMEFCWYWDRDTNQLEVANYRRGTKGKIAVTGSTLARPIINQVALRIRDLLNFKKVSGRDLKTLLLRTNQKDQVVAQLYVKNQLEISEQEFIDLKIKGFEIIYSNPKSPASVITKRLQKFGQTTLSDFIFDKEFIYPAESFFQINLPVYELALAKIKNSLPTDRVVVDFYSGVGTIGLSVVGQQALTMVEVNESAVAEMGRNIAQLGLNAQAILAKAEDANRYITADATLILDPPRAGLHQKVIERILEVLPERIIYLSCNPITQARDLQLLSRDYHLDSVEVYNFFPKTPHIESLIILTKN